VNGTLGSMLTLQRRHSKKCPDRKKGPNYLKCRGGCPLRVCGMAGGKRIRESLKTRDLQRAARRMVELEERGESKPRKSITDAIAAFNAQHADRASGTQRKYKRILGFLNGYCESKDTKYIDKVNVEMLDGYALWRNKTNWTWVKEVEILRQFFTFCIDREWTTKNPAKFLKRPRLLEANDIVPFTGEEIINIITACDQIGRSSYERLRARAMVLLMRYAGLRISDVVTLSKDHIQGQHLVKRAVKNHRMIRVELHPDVLKALAVLPHPKAAALDCRLYFSGGNASIRSLVKGAERTLAAVFKRSKVERAHPHRFRHSLASEILGKGGTIEDAANILGDSPATIRRHYAKWTAEYQARQDLVIRMVHGTNLAQAEEQVSKC
jgi:site-specific recombinase XerD